MDLPHKKVFLDTTALTDLLLKPGLAREQTRRTVKQYSESLLPVYAIKEFKAGPLAKAIYLYNALIMTRSTIKTFEMIRKLSRSAYQKYRFETALELWQVLDTQFGNLRRDELLERYGHLATAREIVYANFRDNFRNLIVKAWKTRRKQTTAIVNPLACYFESAPAEDRKGLFTLSHKKCEHYHECSMALMFRTDPAAVATLLRVLAHAPQQYGDSRRLQVIKKLLKRGKTSLTSDDCRGLGDVVFAFLCPKDAVILTTNIRDHEPLARSLKKQVVSPE